MRRDSEGRSSPHPELLSGGYGMPPDPVCGSNPFSRHGRH